MSIVNTSQRGWGKLRWATEVGKACEWPATRVLALGLATTADSSLYVNVDPDRLRKLGARLGLHPDEVHDAFQELSEGSWLIHINAETHSARLNIPRTDKKDA